MLRYGLIGKTYFTENADVDFDREAYLPVNPEIIWKENQDKIMVYWKKPDEMAFRKAKVNELYEYYLKNFKKYGLGIEKGSISGLFNVHWMWRGGVNIFNYNYTKKLDIMINNVEPLMTPDSLEYLEKALKRGMTERVLYDLNTKRKKLKDEDAEIREYGPVFEQRLHRYMKLYEDYHDQIEVRFTPVVYTTTRQTIYYNEAGPYLASDYRRVLSLDPGELPYYMCTIYLQDELVNHIKENFEAAWANSIPLDEI